MPISPTGALVHAGATDALVLIIAPVNSLREPSNDGWAASPIDRGEELLRASDVRIAVVTDGRCGRWGASSVRGRTPLAAPGIVDAQIWIEAPGARNALVQLLRPLRLIGESDQRRGSAAGRPSSAAPCSRHRSTASALDCQEPASSTPRLVPAASARERIIAVCGFSQPRIGGQRSRDGAPGARPCGSHTATGPPS